MDKHIKTRRGGQNSRIASALGRGKMDRPRRKARNTGSRMSGVSLPVDRSGGRALVVGAAECRALASHVLGERGYQFAEFDEPYSAMAELVKRSGGYQALILSLSSLYREELQIITAVVSRYAKVEIWLTHTDGRPSALAEAMRLLSGAQATAQTQEV